jgi:hypothetical protein
LVNMELTCLILTLDFQTVDKVLQLTYPIIMEKVGAKSAVKAAEVPRKQQWQTMDMQELSDTQSRLMLITAKDVKTKEQIDRFVEVILFFQFT